MVAWAIGRSDFCLAQARFSSVSIADIGNFHQCRLLVYGMRGKAIIYSVTFDLWKTI